MAQFLKVGIAAALAAGSVLAVSAPASADPGHGFGGGFHGGGYAGARGYAGGYHGGYGGYGYRGYGYRGYGYGGFGGGVLLGGLAGLAIGASIHGPYAPGYYGYGTCVAPQQVWNPSVGGYVVQQVPYAC
jgi:hypothetical protein